MRWTDLFPRPIKATLGPIWRDFKSTTWLREALVPRRSREEFHQHWKQPVPGDHPLTYLKGDSRGQFLTENITKHVPLSATILEIGCNAGRNLGHLFRAGFHNLAAVEINPEAIRLLKSTFPTMASRIRLYEAPLEDVIKTFETGEFDVVFSFGTLAHIHPSSEWVFPEIARITKRLLVSVDEARSHTRWSVARDYRRIFEGFGLELVDEPSLAGVEGVDDHYYRAHVFQKPPEQDH